MAAAKSVSTGYNLALSGGGVRACLHIGLYEVLQQHNIPITGIAGSSMGAIVGAAIALGYSADTIKKFAKKYLDLDLFSIKNFNFFNESLMKRDKLTKILDELFGASTFEDTKIPFVCSAVDLESRQEVVFREGSIARAVEASSAYPLIFPPVFYQRHYLIDGGILDEVPAVLARQLSEHPLVAIRIKNNIVRQYISGQIYLKYYKPAQKKGMISSLKELWRNSAPDFRFLIDIVLEGITIASEENVQKTLSIAKPDILLEPIVDIGLLDFSKMDQAIEQGRKLGKELLPKLAMLK